ncbi:MAG: PAS domain-containing protein [Cyclobacteriaceae bacterium]|nr:PAS domain-containing protein [Cyclobacteriaceae bacterium]
MKNNKITTSYIYLIVILILLVFTFDLMLPLGVAFGVIYALPILMTVNINSRKATCLFAVFTTILVLVGYYNSPYGGDLWKVIFNRTISIFTIWSAALSILYYFKIMGKSIEQNKKLAKNNLLLNKLKSVLYETNTLAKIGSWDLDIETKTFFWSDTIKEILEVPLTYKPNWESSIKFFKEDESAKMIYDTTKKAILEGTGFDITTQAFTVKGKVLWLRIIGKPEKKSGKNIRLYGSLQNITEEKLLKLEIEQKKKDLKESEKKFRELFEKSGDAILLLINRRFTECNQATIDMLGYNSKEEFLNTPPDELFPKMQPDGKVSADKAREVINLALENGSHRFEWIYSKKTGENFPVEVLLTTISKKPDTEIIHTVWRDITDRKKSENRLHLSLEENKDIKVALNQSAILAYTNKYGKITYVNDKFVEISKYSKEELIGADHRIINSGYHSKEFMKNMWTTIKAGKIWMGEVKNKAKDGSYYWVQATIVPSIENGEITRFIAIRYDITDRKDAELALKKHQEILENKNIKLEKIAWSFSHKVRAPIVTIMGLSNIFNYEDKCDEINKEVLNKISVPIHSLNELVSSIVKDINDIN